MKSFKAVMGKSSAFSSWVSHKLNVSQEFSICQHFDNQEHIWIQAFDILIFLSSDFPLTSS